MKYYRAAQFVPMKGEAYVYYEAEDDDSVTRCMTVVPSTGEVERMEKPPIRKLFRPEMLEPVSEDDFTREWERG